MCFRPADAQAATKTCPHAVQRTATSTPSARNAARALSGGSEAGGTGAPGAPGAPAAPGAPKAPGVPQRPERRRRLGVLRLLARRRRRARSSTRRKSGAGGRQQRQQRWRRRQRQQAPATAGAFPEARRGRAWIIGGGFEWQGECSMGESTFIKLDSDVKDGGQRIEIDVVVAAPTSTPMEEFYACMARVKQVGGACPERSAGWRPGGRRVCGSLPRLRAQPLHHRRRADLGAGHRAGAGRPCRRVPQRGRTSPFVNVARVRPDAFEHRARACERPEVAVEEADVKSNWPTPPASSPSCAPADHEALRRATGRSWTWTCGNGARERPLRRAAQVEVARGLVPDGFLEGVLGMRAGEMRKVGFRRTGDPPPGSSPAPRAGGAPLPRTARGRLPRPSDYMADVTLRQVQKRVVPASTTRGWPKPSRSSTRWRGFAVR